MTQRCRTHSVPSDDVGQLYNVSLTPSARRPGPHAFDTEARTLDDACDIIRRRQVKAARAKTLKEKAGHPSLAQELAWAANRSRLQKFHGMISLAGGKNTPNPRVHRKSEKLPHPFRSLNDDQKREKARELASSGSWGIGTTLVHKLSVAFGVSKEQMRQWLEGIRQVL